MISLPSRHRLALCLLALVLLGLIQPTQANPPNNLSGTCYLFAYFLSPGTDGLHLIWSSDGLKWKLLNSGKSVFEPTIGHHVLRDPCLLLGPDGIFRLVWTEGGSPHSIGYASSRDLITWTNETEIHVMSAVPSARNCWAPYVTYDAANDRYLIIWASTIPGKFSDTANSSENNYNHRLFITTTKDFVHFAPTRLFYNPGFNTIDATILYALGKYYLIFKNETLFPYAQKNLWMATSNSMAGPYGNLTGTIKTVPPSWVEGPTLIKIDNYYVLYYDCYMNQHFGAARSTDMYNWKDVTSRLSMPKGIRHGSVLAVPSDIVTNLINRK